MPNLSELLRLSLLVVALCPVLGWAAEPAADSTVDLTPHVAPHDLATVTLELAVGGTMQVQQDSGRSAKTQELPMSVAATLKYDEHRAVPKSGNIAARAIRYYDQAEAVLKVENGGLTPRLADARRVIVVENPGGRLYISSPRGILEREELDLIDVVGDSLAIDALLPTKPVAKDATWANDAKAVAGLLSLDSVANCNVECVLDKFNGDFALVRLAGTVVGTADGAATEMDVRGVYLFDRRLQRVTRFNLAVKEIRSIGGATPGLDSVAKLRLDIKPIVKSEHLTDPIVASLETTGQARLEMLRLDVPQQGYRVLHDRGWFITSKERQATRLRRVVNGDVVAQCTVTSLPAKAAGRQLTLEQFEKDIRFALKDNFGELVASRQWANAFHHHCLEVVVRGKTEEIPVEWHYYLVAPESGPSLSVVVTIDGQMVDRLGAADRQFVNAIQLAPPADHVARGPAEASEKSLMVK